MIKKKKRVVCILFALLWLLSLVPVVFAAQPEEVAFYVSPDGSDNADGSFAAPLKTLAAAKERLKAVPEDKTAVVYLRGGEYPLSEPLVFDQTDKSGVAFRAYEREKAVITGAVRLSGFAEETVNGVRVFSVSAGGRKITALFRNGEKLTPARMPENGWYFVSSVNTDDSLWSSETTLWADGTLGQKSFNAALTDFNDAPANMRDVTVHLPHFWHDEVTPMEDYDDSTGRVTMRKYAAMTISAGDRFCLENARNALNKPLEWCFDSAADKIYYVPYSDETVGSVELSASSNAELIKITDARNISFEGLVFKNTGWEYADKKYSTVNVSTWTNGIDMDMPQAAIDVCSAIRAENAHGVSLKRCDFLNIGAWAVKFVDKTESCSVESCRFENTGAGAVFAGGQNTESGCAKNITVKNNVINGYGQRFFSAPAITVTYCDSAEIANNEISNGYYTGISCGWMWLFGYHVTKNIQIKNNLIYNVGQDMLSDMGGVYLLGNQPGTVVSGNVIHDVQCYGGDTGYAGNGIYLDAGTTGINVCNNLVFNCSSFGFFTTISHSNTVRNNIFAFCGEALAEAGGYPQENYCQTSFYNNIFLTKNNVPVYENMASTAHFDDYSNLFWSTDGEKGLLFCEGDTLDGCINAQKAVKKGYIEKGVFADPLFCDAENYDFRFAGEASPAFDSGFFPFELSAAGTVAGTQPGTGFCGSESRAKINADVKEVKYIAPGSGKAESAAVCIGYAALAALALAAALRLIIDRSNGSLACFFGAFAIVGCLAGTEYFYTVNRVEAAFYPLIAAYCALCALNFAVMSKRKGGKKLIPFFIAFAATAAGFLLVLFGLDDIVQLSQGAAVKYTCVAAAVYAAGVSLTAFLRKIFV